MFTDSFQVAVMFISVLTIVLFGVVQAGGPGKVTDDAKFGNRLVFAKYLILY